MPPCWIADQGDAAYAKTPMEQMERRRDDAQVALLHTLAALRASDGKEGS